MSFERVRCFDYSVKKIILLETPIVKGNPITVGFIQGPLSALSFSAHSPTFLVMISNSASPDTLLMIAYFAYGRCK